MFRRKKKEKTVRKMSLSIEQLFDLIKKRPEGPGFEETQQVPSKRNIDADSSTLYGILVKLERDKAITSEIKPRKEGDFDKCWLPVLFLESVRGNLMLTYRRVFIKVEEVRVAVQVVRVEEDKKLTTLKVQSLIYKRRLQTQRLGRGKTLEELVEKANDPRRYAESKADRKG